MSDGRRHLAAVALATGATQSQAAQAANVSLRTIARWSAEPDFRRRVDAEREAVLERATGQIAARFGDLVDRLLVVALEPGPQSPADRLRAIGMALDRGADWIEGREIVRLLQQIEEKMQ